MRVETKPARTRRCGARARPGLNEVGGHAALVGRACPYRAGRAVLGRGPPLEVTEELVPAPDRPARSVRARGCVDRIVELELLARDAVLRVSRRCGRGHRCAGGRGERRRRARRAARGASAATAAARSPASADRRERQRGFHIPRADRSRRSPRGRRGYRRPPRRNIRPPFSSRSTREASRDRCATRARVRTKFGGRSSQPLEQSPAVTKRTRRAGGTSTR